MSLVSSFNLRDTSWILFILIFLHLVFTSLRFHANSSIHHRVVGEQHASYNRVTLNINPSLRFLITHQRNKFVNPQPYLLKWHISVFTLWSLSLRGKLFVFSCIDRKILQHLNTDSFLWMKERWRAHHLMEAAFTKPRTLQVTFSPAPQGDTCCWMLCCPHQPDVTLSVY